MSNNKSDVDVFERSKYLRRNALLLILVVIVIVSGVFAFNQFKEVQQNQKELSAKQDKAKKTEVNNKKIAKENEELFKKIGTYDTLMATKDFYDKFYNWNSWEQYANNMKVLQNTYPNIDDGDVVDISGKDVGTGSSPESSYTEKNYVGTEKGQIGQFITQTKKYEDREGTAIWYIVSDYKDGKLNISQMKPYREASSN
ncbi:hypothetical protein V074_02579 [Staphylococcus aureus 2010-60-1240-1]|uniref:hypothetical protein n=1 Tax=Staphylococcus aureus TaxID=1280 RepID=UPI00044B57E3|nr:hypothetical protein [Staphylococcus aureus]EZV57624.1 hypothetical protein V074_02579 [Staphylococcus aureus 2010-60-1240-1]